MKHNFLKKLTALLLGTIMVFSMIPAIAIGTKAAEVTGNKITTLDELTSGEYIIVSTAGYVLQKLDGTWVTVSALTNGSTVTTDSANVWTVEVTDSGVTLTDSNSVTIAPTGASTNGITSGSHNWQVSVSDGKFTFEGASGYAVTLACNKTYSYKVRAYKNTTVTNATSYPSTFYLYKLGAACTHENTEAIGTPSDATCTEDGITAGEKCSDCGEIITEQETIEATGHTDVNPVDSKCDTCGTNLCIEHVWVDGEVVTEGDCTTDRVVSQVCDNCGEPGEDKVTTAPGHTPVVDKAKDATCTETGLTEGSHCDVCDAVIESQTVVPMIQHNFVNNVCSVCGASGQTYVKVTTAPADWTAGTYLIVYEAGKLAFNGSLEKLDAGKNGVSVNLEDSAIIGDYKAYVFCIEKVESGYAIKSASGRYIGRTATGNGLNESTSDAYVNTISIDTSGNAVIVSNNLTLRYNATSGDNNQRFRYYASGQQAIALYKLVDETSEPEVEAPAYKGFGLTINKGVTVRVKFNITQEWIDANPEKAFAKFSNGTVCENLIAGENTFTTTLTPGQIGDDLTVSIMVGDEAIITKDVSVSAYIEKAKEAYASDTELCDLLDAIEVYGKAAAKVEQTLTAPDFNAIADPVVTDKSVIPGFADATLGEYATVGLTINAEDGYTFVASRGTVTTGKLLLADHLDNGALYIENIRPANFGDVITVTVYDGDTVVSSISFTFNSYLKLAYDKAGDDVKAQNIVTAAYNYGVAAAAYLEQINAQ